VGTRLLTRLAELRHQFRVVGDVRGKGLMIGVELVRDRVRKQLYFMPLKGNFARTQVSKAPVEREAMARLLEALRDRGLIVGKGGVFGSVYV